MPPRAAADSVSLNKYISDTGFCSRREADSYINNGRVTINDQVAITGNRVAAGDVVEIDGEPIGRKKATVYIAYHKPTGITSTTDARDKTNIVDAIGYKQRIFPIGRLDKDSEGLIFLTNDGNIVNKILRSGNEHEKEYIVTVDKPINQEFVDAMAAGVRLSDATTMPCKVVQEGRSTIRITLIQGLNRQIRRMCTALGFEVKKLRRVRIMNVHLGGLAAGHWRYLTAEETQHMMRLVSASESDGKQARPPVKQKAAAPTGNRKASNSGKLPEQQELKKPVRKSAASKKTSEVRETPARKEKSYKEFREGSRKRR